MKDSKNNLKRNKASLVSIILAVFMLLISLATFSTSSYFSYKNYTMGKGYDCSYNVRYEFDPYSRSEDPALGLRGDDEVKEAEVRENMNKNATAFSSMLAESGISNSNVYSEVYTDSNGKVHAYLNATIPNKKVASSLPSLSDEEKNKQDIAMSREYYSCLDSSRFTFIYCDGYTVPATGASNNDFKKAKLYLWDLHDITDSDDKITINKSDSTKINIQLKKGLTFGKKNGNDYEKNSIKDVLQSAPYIPKSTTNDDKKDQIYPFIYVIRDFRGMINYLQYLLRVYWYYNYSHIGNLETKYPEIYKAYFQLSSTEKRFIESIFKDDSIWVSREDSKFLKYEFDNDAGFQKNAINKLDPSTQFSTSNSLSTPFAGENNLLNSAVLTVIQALNDDGFISPGKSIGYNSEYPFLRKYIMNIINRDNYLDYLVDKNPNNKNLDSYGQWLVLSNEWCGNYYTTKQIVNQMTKNKFTYPLMDTVYTSLDASSTVGNIENLDTNGLSKFVNISKINGEINGSLLISNAVLTTIISLVILLLLIGILVSYLYRVPGFISFINLITPIPLTIMTVFMSGYGFTLPIMMAMLMVIVMGAFSIFSIMSRIKKYHLSHRTLDQSIIEGFKKSLLPALDLHVVLFLLGACCLFFSISDLLAIGVTLLLGSILSFLFVYIFNFLTNYLTFANAIGMYKFQWFSKYKISLDTNSIPKAFANYEASMVEHLTNKSFENEGVVSQIHVKTNWLLNWKTFIIVIFSCIGLFVLGSLIGFVSGVPAFNYYGGTRLMIQNDGNITLNVILDKLNALHVSWHNISYNAQFFYLECSKNFDNHESYVMIANALSGLTFFVQNIDSQSTFNFSLNVVYILLAFVGFMFVYGLVRYNWISSLSILLSSFAPLTLVAIIVITQIYFDVNIIYAVIMIAALSQMLTFTLLSSLASHWFKKNFVQTPELKSIYAYVMSSLTDNLILYVIVMGLLILTMLFFLPANLWFVAIFVLFGTISTFAIIYMVVPYLTLIFTGLKNRYRLRLQRIQSGIEKRNFDKIDEELINTINVNTSQYKNF